LGCAALDGVFVLLEVEELFAAAVERFFFFVANQITPVVVCGYLK
jgi:hypothetical protein